MEREAGRKRFIGRTRSGSTATEYALIASLIAVIVVASVTSLSTALQDVFDTVEFAVTGP